MAAEHGTLKRVHGSQQYDVSYTYDPQGRPRTMTTSTGVTTWNYSPTRGFLTSEEHADAKATMYTNTLAGRLETRLWQRGITTTYGKSNAGDVSSITYSDSTPSVSFTYDRLGAQNSITDASGTRTQTVHPFGKVTAENYTAGVFNGLTIGRTLDNQLRQTGLTATLSSATLTSVSYGFDNASRLDTVTSGDVVADYDYHSLSSLVQQIRFLKNSALKMTSSKEFDHLNRLMQISNKDASDVVKSSFAYQYNSLNQRTRATLVDGNYWIYEMDNEGQLISAKRYWSTTNLRVPGQQFEYDFDGIGNRTSTTVNGRNASYMPNNVNQITQRDVPGALDLIGSADAQATVTINNQRTVRNGDYFYGLLAADNTVNPVVKTVNIVGVRKNADPNSEDVVTTQTGDLILPQTPEVISHDDDGNRTQDGLWHYVWNGENQLIEMRSVSAIPAAKRRNLTFKYDSAGRRFEQIVYAWDSGANDYAATGVVTRFIYEGWNLLAEVDGTGGLIRSYVWGLDVGGSLTGAGGVGGLLTYQTYGSGAGTSAAMFDGNGNVVGSLDLASGTQNATLEYDPFGNTLRADGEKVSGLPIRFSTKYQNSETGLYYYGFRYYDPITGQFLSRDPIGEMGGANLYGFVGNNPTNQIDPLGLAVLRLHLPLVSRSVLKDRENFRRLYKWR